MNPQNNENRSRVSPDFLHEPHRDSRSSTTAIDLEQDSNQDSLTYSVSPDLTPNRVPHMEYLRRSLVWLVQVLFRRWFFLFTLFCLYYYHVRLDKDMRCSCKSQSKDCWVYLLVPGFILMVVQLWVDMVFGRGLKFLCGGVVRVKVLPLLIKRLLEASFVGHLWVQSVLLDGDWYICCGRGNIRCPVTNNYYIPGLVRPDSEELRNESQVIGLLLVFVVFLAAAILSWLPWGRWCASVFSDWPEAVLEEAELTTAQQMRTFAQKQLQTKVDQPGANWRKWEELERELLLDQGQAQTQVQTSVLMSSLTNADSI
ncbi:hypothetical protein WMY93_027848 [Mugilogobius chulae]|uniref:Uncharacterized protein n=1 Tax=Mugilogobius chulae TaxID=88201 RepID=A0AAW0N559_9GOBI